MKRVAVLGLLLASGCGRNAFLELEVDLPAPTTPKRYAVIAIASGDQSFDARWAGNQTIGGVELGAPKPISIEGTSDSFDKPVEVKVTFCVDPNCNGKGDDLAPEVHLKIERAFYEGKRTSYTWKIACVPGGTCTEPTDKDVSKCEVAGCRQGTSSSYCVGDKHFCES